MIQAGQFAFLFTRDGRLVPETGIAGCAVTVPAGFHVGERLDLADAVSITSGECVGMIGPSGAGKSTLLKAIAQLPETRGSRGILIEGADAPSSGSQSFRDLLGYLSQDPFVHEVLTALQVMTFIAALRCPAKALGKADFENILRELEIPEGSWNQPIGHLSGGEQKRVRIAAEVISTPRLFLLDEPGSGLDAKREQTVMRMLRNLSHRGCTVVVVTHGRNLTPFFDLVIRVTKSDGKSRIETFRGDAIPAAFSDGAAPAVVAVASPVRNAPQPAARQNESGRGRVVSQFTTLLRRETTLMGNEFISRVAIPLAIPCLFACALALAIPNDALDRLGFFCVLSAIWLGASLSLLSIVGERDVFDHESFLYLRTGPYLAAKFGIYSAMALGQTAAFFLCLFAMRRALDRDCFESGSAILWFLAIYLSLEISGIALGLCVSACAGRSKNAANLMLPLVMIAQMVFSASAAGATGPLPNVYRDFHAKSPPSASLSYLLASRYGDVLVHGCLNPYRVTESVRADEGFMAWAKDAFGGLAAITSLLVGLTYAALKLQISGFLSGRWNRITLEPATMEPTKPTR